MDFNEDGIIIANDDEGNVWEGKEFYDFLFNDLFDYNENGTVDLIDNKDFERLKEYRKKYDFSEQNEIIPSEKENIVSTNNLSQLSLFIPKEQELADRIVEEFNALDTKYKGTFYVSSIVHELAVLYDDQPVQADRRPANVHVHVQVAVHHSVAVDVLAERDVYGVVRVGAVVEPPVRPVHVVVREVGRDEPHFVEAEAGRVVVDVELLQTSQLLGVAGHLLDAAVLHDEAQGLAVGL